MAEKNLLIVCGEPSGELRAAELLEELKKIEPKLKVYAVGSELLRSKNADVFYDFRELAAIGLFDVLKKLPKFLALQDIVLKKIKEVKPCVVILIDFSGFNLRLAKKINNRLPVIYYVSPQVWASRSGRVKTIKKFIKKILVLFEFEVSFYQKYGIKAEYIGHPLIDTVKPTLSKKELLNALNFSEHKITLGLFPGSRKEEIKRILPIMLESASLISREIEIQIVVAKLPDLPWQLYEQFTKKIVFPLKIVEGKPYDCMNIADFCLVCSGTATLETALMQKPFVIIYRTSFLNYLLYRPLIKIPFIGLVNILAKEMVVPEFIQFNAKPYRIARSVLKILSNKDNLAFIQKKLSTIKNSLGQQGAAARAAQSILKFIS